MIAKAVSFDVHENIGVVQLTTSDHDVLEYITGEVAVKKGWIEIREVSEGGNVNELILLNTSDAFVFLMDGDVLMGAKQNRVVNTSMLLKPQTKSHIPVSCVERGRWSRVSPRFDYANYSAPPGLRSMKSESVRLNLDRQRGFSSDQGEIWNGVESYQRMTKSASPTSNLSDVMESQRKRYESLAEKIRPVDGACGMAVFIERDLVGLDLFHRRDVFSEYCPKILRGIGFEAMTVRKTDTAIDETEARFKAEECFDEIQKASVKSFPSVGVGTEHRFTLEKGSGFNLEYDGHIIHLSSSARRKHTD
jgi:hypothetical protein